MGGALHQEYLMKYDPGIAFKSGKGLSGHLSDIKGALSGLRQFLAIQSPLKMMKCFLFHLESSFCSQNIYFFVLTFWSCGKIAGIER